MDESNQPVYRITDLAVNERPRERLAHLGPRLYLHLNELQFFRE
jgi:hypothetical protein